ncbi:tubulin-specific chaperone A isoform X5 [Rissa tridactyla]|uniref:tubulin-specific chaperone A isoform X5 n=1 Tax=Rissa tridactyla TaxID=75485 RepID=UPI0023BB04A6|nr:tubulin-specific chaperone A isoform X5 [Rissa tridactyla]
MADPRLRQIKIKTGVVRRLAKEKVMYEKEARQQEEKIEKMKAEACDDYGIKKQPLHEHQHDCRSWNLDNSTCIISAGVNTFWIPDFMLRIKGTCAVFGVSRFKSCGVLTDKVFSKKTERTFLPFMS